MVIIEKFSSEMCVRVCVADTDLCEDVNACAHDRAGPWVLLYHPLLHSFESLSNPGARLIDGKPQQFPFSAPHTTKIITEKRLRGRERECS